MKTVLICPAGGGFEHLVLAEMRRLAGLALIMLVPIERLVTGNHDWHNERTLRELAQLCDHETALKPGDREKTYFH